MRGRSNYLNLNMSKIEIVNFPAISAGLITSLLGYAVLGAISGDAVLIFLCGLIGITGVFLAAVYKLIYDFINKK